MAQFATNFSVSIPIIIPLIITGLIMGFMIKAGARRIPRKKTVLASLVSGGLNGAHAFVLTGFRLSNAVFLASSVLVGILIVLVVFLVAWIVARKVAAEELGEEDSEDFAIGEKRKGKTG